MILIEELSKPYTKGSIDKMAVWVCKDEMRFKELIHLFLKGENRISQKASWVMSHAFDINPSIIKPYLHKLLLKANEPDIHDAIKRNVARIFQCIEIPNKEMGLAVNVFFKLLINPNEATAVRAFSMTVLFNISKKEPDLKNELKLILAELVNSDSAAIKNRAKHILKEIDIK